MKMKDTKKEFKWFSISDYDKEQEYLGEMHKNGWKLKKIAWPGIYCFEKCAPKDVVYQLDYNPEGISSKTEYVKMFSDCGWEYLFDFVGYSYFRKESDNMNGEEEIFCDDESRLDMMKRVFKGRVVPLITIFFGIIIPQLFMHTNQSGEHFLGDFLTITFFVMFILYLSIFFTYGSQFFRYERKLKGDQSLFWVKYIALIVLVILLFLLATFSIIQKFGWLL